MKVLQVSIPRKKKSPAWRKFLAGALMAISLSAPATTQAMNLRDLFKAAVISGSAMMASKKSSDTEKAAIVIGASVAAEILDKSLHGEQVTQKDIQDSLARGSVAGAAVMTTDKNSSDVDRAVRAGAGVLVYDAVKDMQAARTGKKVVYRTRDGSVVEVDPVMKRRPGYSTSRGSNGVTRCRKIHRRVWKDGKLVVDRVEEICRSEKVERGYENEAEQQPALDL